MDFKRNYFSKKLWRHKAFLFLYTFQNISSTFFDQIEIPRYSLRKMMGRFPSSEKNGLFLSFPGSFYLCFTEAHGRRLELVAHASPDCSDVRFPLKKLFHWTIHATLS